MSGEYLGVVSCVLKYLGVVSCVLPMIREMGDEWKVSTCSQMCVTDDQGVVSVVSIVSSSF